MEPYINISLGVRDAQLFDLALSVLIDEYTGVSGYEHDVRDAEYVRTYLRSRCVKDSMGNILGFKESD